MARRFPRFHPRLATGLSKSKTQKSAKPWLWIYECVFCRFAWVLHRSRPCFTNWVVQVVHLSYVVLREHSKPHREANIQHLIFNELTATFGAMAQAGSLYLAKFIKIHLPWLVPYTMGGRVPFKGDQNSWFQVVPPFEIFRCFVGKCGMGPPIVGRRSHWRWVCQAGGYGGREVVL